MSDVQDRETSERDGSADGTHNAEVDLKRDDGEHEAVGPEDDVGEGAEPMAEAASEAQPAPAEPVAMQTAAAAAQAAALAAQAASPPGPGAYAPPPQQPPPQQPPPQQPPPEPARSSATPIAWLALLLVLAVAVAGFMQFTEGQRREAELLQRVQGLESVSGQDVTTFDQMRDNLQRQIELEIEGMRAREQRAQEDQQRAADSQQRAVAQLESAVASAAADTRRALSGELETLQRAIDEQRQALRTQQQLVSELSVEDRESWQIAEVQYLLRLANQRLIMTGDTISAEALLRSADNILRDLDDSTLLALRSAVANDLAAVRAVPVLDTQGLYLRLDALIQQTDELVMYELPERDIVEPVAPAEDWRERLTQGYDAALAKLSEYIVVSRTDVPVEALMDPQYELLVRQNMRMLLEQAQVAMLSGNEVLFRQSLERAQGWVSQFFKADQQAAVAMGEELRAIAGERVSVTLPDLNASLRALDEAMQARLARNGG